MSYGSFSPARVTPGKFYLSVQPGHFTDAATGLIFKGPVVELHPDTRQPIRVTSMPEPTRIPTHRTVDVQTLDGKYIKRVESFSYVDDRNGSTVDALDLALGTGVLREVSEQELSEHWPHLAGQDNEYLFKGNEAPARPMLALIDEFNASRDALQQSEAEALSALHGADKSHAAGAAK